MSNPKAEISNSILRSLPSVDALLRSSASTVIIATAGEAFTRELARRSVDELRRRLSAGEILASTKEHLFDVASEMMQAGWENERALKIRRVINATGVIIHTNMGRAPLADEAIKSLTGASGYCTLEFDIETGSRGRRGLQAERILVELTGAEDVLIVNNCAAAAFLVLSVFAGGGEVIVSRGELVEIGGDFRIPDVLTQSGAHLREVGTTNRTRIADYEHAVNDLTRMLLRVHPSNYRILGFTKNTTLPELVALARRRDILLYEDIGSGVLTRRLRPLLSDEPVIADSIAAGVDAVTFSGDKLLGGPQAGIIAGKRSIVDQLRCHPLYRALRADKLTLSALETTLEIYRRDELEKIPVLKMLAATRDQIAARATSFVERCQSACDGTGLKFQIMDGVSATGGGAAPTAVLETKLVGLRHALMSAATLEEKLRNSVPPVIARITNDMVMLDLRTVSEKEETDLMNALVALD